MTQINRMLWAAQQGIGAGKRRNGACGSMPETLARHGVHS